MRCKKCNNCSYTDSKKFELVDDIGWLCAECYEKWKEDQEKIKNSKVFK